MYKDNLENAKRRRVTNEDAHAEADTDVEANSIHHTLGVGTTQAARGSHGHEIPIGGGGYPADTKARINLSYDPDRNELWVKSDGIWHLTGIVQVANLSDLVTPRVGVAAYESATDSVYYYTGSEWKFVAGDPPWISFPGVGGINVFGAGYGQPVYRKVGRKTEFAGLLKAVSAKAAGSIIGSGFPAPGSNRLMVTDVNGTHNRLDMSTAGNLTTVNALPLNASILLDGLFYWD